MIWESSCGSFLTTNDSLGNHENVREWVSEKERKRERFVVCLWNRCKGMGDEHLTRGFFFILILGLESEGEQLSPIPTQISVFPFGLVNFGCANQCSLFFFFFIIKKIKCSVLFKVIIIIVFYVYIFFFFLSECVYILDLQWEGELLLGLVCSVSDVTRILC